MTTRQMALRLMDMIGGDDRDIPVVDLVEEFVVKIRAEATQAERERILAIVEREPELPNAMPSEMANEVRRLNDASLAESYRIVVRVTKRNIMQAIRALPEEREP